MRALAEITTELSHKIDEAVSVIVARQGGSSGIEARKLALANDAADAFRELSRDCGAALEASTAVAYTAEAELERPQVFVVDDRSSLDELHEFRSLTTEAASLPTIAPRDLDLAIQFYAVVVGDNDRVLLVRRTNPQIPYRSGRWLAIAGEQLRKLEEPAFSFSSGFDLLISDTWAVILNQAAFERLFRETGLVDSHIATWLTGITDHLPMDRESLTLLLEIARKDSRTWRRLREIQHRGHLAHVGLPEVRKYARRVHLDPNKIVQKGKLVFDPTTRFSFLHLLNEDLYQGPLTDETFEAQRKARASVT